MATGSSDVQRTPVQPRTYWMDLRMHYVYGFKRPLPPGVEHCANLTAPICGTQVVFVQACGVRLFHWALSRAGYSMRNSEEGAEITIRNLYDKRLNRMAPQSGGEMTNYDPDSFVRGQHKVNFAETMRAWSDHSGFAMSSFHPFTAALREDGSSSCSLLAETQRLLGGPGVGPETAWVVKTSNVDLAAGLRFSNWSEIEPVWAANCESNRALFTAMQGRFWNRGVFRQRAFRLGRRDEPPVLLVQKILEPPLLLDGRRMSSRDYIFIIRAAGLSMGAHHLGYIMRCVTAGCVATNRKSENGNFSRDEDWAPFRFSRRALAQRLPAAVASRLRASHNGALRNVTGALLLRASKMKSTRGRGALQWFLLGTDAVFNDRGEAQVLEVNRSPELFCRQTEGSARRQNNIALVQAVAGVLVCLRDWHRLSAAELGALWKSCLRRHGPGFVPFASVQADRLEQHVHPQPATVTASGAQSGARFVLKGGAGSS